MGTLQGQLEKIYGKNLGRPDPVQEEKPFPFDTTHFETFIRPKLEIYKEDGLTLFHGSQIENEANGAEYLRPALFEGADGRKHIFHYVYVNCTPEDVESGRVTPTVMPVHADDTGVKTGDTRSGSYRVLNQALRRDGKPKIVIRRAMFGNIAWPDIVVDTEHDPKTDFDHLGAFQRYLSDNGIKGINLDMTQMKDMVRSRRQQLRSTGLDRREGIRTKDGMMIFAARKISIPRTGQFFVYDVEMPNDPWKIYQIYTRTPLKDLERGVDNLVVRLDSGCECGHIYDDRACDCRHQFHLALKRVKEESDQGTPGMVLHIPAHDGRGFGTAPKAETELTKVMEYGPVVGAEAFKDPAVKDFFRINIHTGEYYVDTVGAAEMLYGKDNPYDIRTFDGAAKILGLFDPKRVILLTNNVAKTRALQGDFEVIAEPVYTDINQVPASTRGHVLAKLQSALYKDTTTRKGPELDM